MILIITSRKEAIIDSFKIEIIAIVNLEQSKLEVGNPS
jgi:hypothetical protein